MGSDTDIYNTLTSLPQAPPTEAPSARTSRMLARFLGEGVMAGFYEEDVTEVYTNPQDGAVWFDTRTCGKVRAGVVLAPARAEQFLNAVADLHGLTLSAERPALQAELPRELFRGAWVSPVSVERRLSNSE